MEGGRRGRGMGRGRVLYRSPSGPRRGFRSPTRAVTGLDAVESVASSLSSISVTDDGPRETSSDSPATAARQGGIGGGAIRGVIRGASFVEPDDSDSNVVGTGPDGRVKTGNRGTKLSLRGNFYRLKTVPGWALYQYHVDFQPEENRTRIKKILFRGVAENLLNISYMFDGASLFTSKHFVAKATGQLMAEGETTVYTVEAVENSGMDDEVKYAVTITIKFVKGLTPESPIYARLYNLLIKKCLFGMELAPIGRNFFDHKAAIKIPQYQLELWPGYVTSMRVHDDKSVLLCVEMTHKVFRQNTVLQQIEQIKGNCKNDRAALVAAVNAELKDMIVMTMYNRKTYHVDEVDFSVSPKSTFEGKDGSISYAEYYKSRYGRVIQDLNQPLLVSKPRKMDVHVLDDYPVFLVPELCQSTGITDDMRADFRLMKYLRGCLQLEPNVRVKEIELFMKRLMDNVPIRKEFETWGLEFEPNMVELNGRIFPNEAMIFGNNVTQPVDNQGDYTMVLKAKQMLSAVSLKRWVIITPKLHSASVDGLVQAMMRAATTLSIVVTKPHDMIKLADTRIETYLLKLDELLKEKSGLQMVFVILPHNKLDLYAAVKKRLSVDAGIPSQCFLAKSLFSASSLTVMSIATSVVIQMNVKLGGEPWTLKLPLDNTMFVGFDVCSQPKKGREAGIGAMVATFSSKFTKYFSTTSTFLTNEELAKNMRMDISMCIKAYQEERGAYPECIIVYRAGVRENQLHHVYDVELAGIRQELADKYKSARRTTPKLTYVVVTKRINAKFFNAKQQSYENPPPGTVVDTVVTLPEKQDFYLISCAPRQGTVSPCSYNVLLDESNFSPDRMQQITYKLCHMYFNWSGTIAVPAPCQYAHKLAFLTGMAYSGHANNKLSKLLHFL